MNADQASAVFDFRLHPRRFAASCEIKESDAFQIKE